jgi:dTDP-4-amino-4,6-dideoxygalactose transaminase
MYADKGVTLFSTVADFEKQIAEYFGAPYAVATDSCTHAIELSIRYTQTEFLSIPSHTYISVPFTAEKLGIDWDWKNVEWADYYFLSPNIIDAAVFWKQRGYISSTFMCLSFQYKKHLKLGRGGAILCDNYSDYLELKKMSYDGRMPGLPWATQDISTIGYHYYMTPETAQLGLDMLDEAKRTSPEMWSWRNYPNLTMMSVFRGQQ